MERLRFCLNDRWVELSGLSPTTTLLRYLRDHARLTGTKEGCAEGDCGACSVAVIETDLDGAPRYRAVNSCLLLLPMIQGKRVYTVEALKREGVHHPAQRALAERLGSQCGYCTPGVVMSLFEACYRDDLDEPWKLDAQMCGNLCRCTGYRPIRDAAQAIGGTLPAGHFSEQLTRAEPAAMQLRYVTPEQRFFTPASFDELFEVIEKNPDARFVCGGTDLSLEITKRFAEPPTLISLEGVAALREIRSAGLLQSIGATVNLSELESWARGHLTPLERMLRYFGSRQIKSRATVGGNLCNASPIGDLPPVFLALDAEAVLRSRSGERRVPLERFFLSYRKTALAPGEILAAIEVRTPPAAARIGAYKVSKRRELDISAVSACLRVETDSSGVVTLARLAYGGMAATPARATQAEQSLLGQPWTAPTVERAAASIEAQLKPLSDHRGSARYRMRIAQNLLRAFFEETSTAPVRRLPHPHTATVQAR